MFPSFDKTLNGVQNPRVIILMNNLSKICNIVEVIIKEILSRYTLYVCILYVYVYILYKCMCICMYILYSIFQAFSPPVYAILSVSF